MTKKELVAEITSDFKQYDESGLIDYRSLDLWIKNAIKRFGNNVMVLTEKTVIVENGLAQLPDNFWKLVVAAKCDDGGYEVCGGKKEHVIMSHYWKMRTERSYEWDNNSESYTGHDFKEIKEKVYFDGGLSIDFYYRNPTILRLTRGMKKEVCHSSCRNLSQALTNSASNEINILGNTIQANFTHGFIYLQYLGLPTDQEGELEVPETQHNSLQNYIMYHCKAKILENIVANEDDPGKGNLLQYFSSKEREYFSLAMTESKFSGLGTDWDIKLKNQMRQNTMKYELMFPTK